MNESNYRFCPVCQKVYINTDIYGSSQVNSILRRCELLWQKQTGRVKIVE